MEKKYRNRGNKKEGQMKGFLNKILASITLVVLSLSIYGCQTYVGTDRGGRAVYETDYTPLIIGVFISLICGAVCASIAERKRRSALGWSILGLMFGPIAIVIVSVIGPGEKEKD